MTGTEWVALQAETDQAIAELRDSNPLLGKVLAILDLRLGLVEQAMMEGDGDEDE